MGAGKLSTYQRRKEIPQKGGDSRSRPQIVSALLGNAARQHSLALGTESRPNRHSKTVIAEVRTRGTDNDSRFMSPAVLSGERERFGN